MLLSTMPLQIYFSQASAVAHWLEDCQTTIDTACAHHETINATQKELLQNCSTIMNQFKERSEICQVKSMSVFECFSPPRI